MKPMAILSLGLDSADQIPEGKMKGAEAKAEASRNLRRESERDFMACRLERGAGQERIFYVGGARLEERGRDVSRLEGWWN